MAPPSETTDIELSTALVDRVEQRVTHTEFDAVNEYIEYVLHEVLFHVEETTDDEDTEPVDEAEVRRQLRALGYVDE